MIERSLDGIVILEGDKWKTAFVPDELMISIKKAHKEGGEWGGSFIFKHPEQFHEGQIIGVKDILVPHKVRKVCKN